jgi:hypothetical protein
MLRTIQRVDTRKCACIASSLGVARTLSLSSNRFDAFERVSRDVRDRGLFIVRAHDYFHSTL